MQARRWTMWVAALLLFGVVAVVASRVHDTTGPLRVDQRASGVAHSGRLERVLEAISPSRYRTGALPRKAIALVLPGLAGAAVMALALVALVRRDYWAAVLCIAGPVLAVVLTDMVAKPVINRRVGVAYMFPSGHTSGAAAVATVVAVMAHRWGGWWTALVVAPMAAALPLVMGFALVRAEWHYPTDVVGGAAMGAATVLAVAGLRRAAA